MSGRPRRSDLTPLMVCRAIRDHEFDAVSQLCARFPPKVVLAAIHRDVDNQLIDYGVSANCPWLEAAGKQLLADAGEPTEREGQLTWLERLAVLTQTMAYLDAGFHVGPPIIHIAGTGNRETEETP